MIWLALLPWVLLTAHTAVNAVLLRRLPETATTDERVAVLLPLRNEADRVRPCLESLLAQQGVPNLTIYILDDDSTDGTADVVRSIVGDGAVHPTASNDAVRRTVSDDAVRPTAGDDTVRPTAGDDAVRPTAGDDTVLSIAGDAAVRSIAGGKVHLLAGAPPPTGWLGKPHACHQLAEAAAEADVLSFVDADVVLAPHAIAAGTNLLRKIDATLLSPYPRITGAGRLIQPLLQWSWLTFLPLRAMERSPRPSLSAAGGQWLLADRRGYDRAGGHAAVRAEVMEDMALARVIKRTGGVVSLADGAPQATCHMYRTWPDVVAGYTKSLWSSFGSAPAAAAVVVTLLLLYAAPPAAALILAATASTTPALVALAAYALAVIGRMTAAQATGSRPWPDPLAHPAAIATVAWLVARSFRQHRKGSLTWRGRPL